jgi:hypothetical protein
VTWFSILGQGVRQRVGVLRQELRPRQRQEQETAEENRPGTNLRQLWYDWNTDKDPIQYNITQLIALCV